MISSFMAASLSFAIVSTEAMEIVANSKENKENTVLISQLPPLEAEKLIQPATKENTVLISQLPPLEAEKPIQPATVEVIEFQEINPQKIPQDIPSNSLPIAEKAIQPTSVEVIEFYYADPQKIPQNIPTNPLPTTEQQADDLGTPISVGTTEQTADREVEELDNITGKIIELTEKRLVATRRNGESKTYQFSQNQPYLSQNSSSETSDEGETVPSRVSGVIELIADQQEYDAENQIVIAKGNVVMRLANAVLLADRLRVNIPDRLAVAEGEVVLQRGDQTLRGEKFEYYFVQDRGVVFNAYGEIYQKTTARDFAPTLPTDLAGFSGATLSERLSVNQPVQNIKPEPGFQTGIGTSLDPANAQPATRFSSPFSSNQQGGQINRVRFQAEQIEFNSQGWDAQKVRLTNDPFSPPELEVRAETATFRPVAPLVDELRLSNSRLVLDQTVAIPTQNRLVFDRREREPEVLSLGFDGEERGGLYIQRGFNIIDNEWVRWEVKPQYLIQKAFLPDSFPEANPSDDDVGPLTPSVFGLTWKFDATFSQRTNLYNRFSLASLNLGEAEDYLRTQLGIQHYIGDLSRPHDLRFEYNFRERLFNGSLGFQTVQSSIGAILVSPYYSIGNTGISLTYQASAQYINSATDRFDLLVDQSKFVNGRLINNRVSLMRYQGAASINRYFTLWRGQALPPTPEEGLKYTPFPVVPYIQFGTSLTGVASYYSSGDNQPSLSGSISLLGQFGHFSRPFLDYTGFNIVFSQSLRGDESPFFFDRFVDTQTLTLGLTQQVYGPVRIGIQTVRNLELNSEITTDYFIEYSRRTYNVLVRYNPALEIGSINLRISDFNWSGNPGPFEGTGVRPVIQGVTR